MSLDSYHHGVRVIEVNDGARSIQTVSSSIFGIVCVAEDANASKFPLNTPVLVTDPASALADAGEDGTLAMSLKAISDQARAVGVVVRVEKGEDVGETTTNVTGEVTEEGQRTGLQALLVAQSMLGVKPRIIGAPGLDNAAVAAALVTVAQKLNAFAYAECANCETIEEALEYREDFAARELMLLYPGFKVWDGNAEPPANVNVSAVSHAIGLRAKIDSTVGWHKTISNVAVAGVTGLSMPVFWDLQSSETDAGLLNEAGITTIINQGGFKFWGSRTCSDDPLFAFESAVRTGQIIKDTIAEAHMWAADKPLHPSIAKDILEGVNAKLRQWTALGYILGGEAWLDEQVNTTATLKTGQLVIDFDYTPVAPLEDLAFRQRITDRYYGNFAARVAG